MIKIGDGLLVEYRTDENWGTVSAYFDLDTTPLDTHRYRFVQEHGGIFLCKNLEGNYGIISKKGFVVYAPQFPSITHSGCGLVGVNNGKYWGYLDSTGAVAIPFEFYEGTQCVNQAFAAKDTLGDWYLYSIKGEKLEEKPYRQIYVSPGGQIMAFQEKSDGKLGFMNAHGEEIIEAQFTNFFKPTGEEYWRVERDEKWGMLNGCGELVIDISFDFIKRMNEKNYLGIIDGEEVEISL